MASALWSRWPSRKGTHLSGRDSALCVTGHVGGHAGPRAVTQPDLGGQGALLCEQAEDPHRAEGSWAQAIRGTAKVLRAMGTGTSWGRSARGLGTPRSWSARGTGAGGRSAQGMGTLRGQSAWDMGTPWGLSQGVCGSGAGSAPRTWLLCVCVAG